MNAIALLLCLALARDIAGSIFRHEYYPAMDRLIDQPMDYDQQQQMRAPRMHQKHRHSNHHHQRDSENSESKDKSYEDMNSYYNNLQTVRNWNSPLFTAIANQDDTRPMYGDMVTWNGVQIATGPNSPITDQKDIEKIFNDAYKTMKHFTAEEKEKFHSAYLNTEKKEYEDTHLNSSQLLKKHQFKVEEHTVHTDDGYQLTIFRIEPKNSENKQNAQETKDRPAVFLAHGLLGSSDDWLLMGPQKSLAFILADNGYEVWLGNARGSKYARQHASKHEAQPDFWHYSNDEIALHDTPAMIDHALKSSEQEKLHYVGISQGTTAVFALISTRPEYNKRIASVHAISPMVYMTKVRSPLLRIIAPNSPFYERLEEQLGSGEFKPSKELTQTIGGDLCENEVSCKKVCSNIYFVMAGVGDLSTELAPVIMGHLPAGASTRQMRHYGQGIVSHEFRKFDHGPEINRKVYGHVQPPKYKISNVQVPVVLYSTENDWLSHPEDVTRLHKELPNLKGHHKITEDHFTHMDFLFSEKAPHVVYKDVIENIKHNQESN